MGWGGAAACSEADDGAGRVGGVAVEGRAAMGGGGDSMPADGEGSTKDGLG